MDEREKSQRIRAGVGRRFIQDVSHLVAEFVAFFVLYSFIVTVLNHAALLISGAYKGMTAAQISAATPVAAPGVIIHLPNPVAEIIIACIVLGVITYFVLQYVCRVQWVLEPVRVRVCWEEVQWWNPFSWIVAIVCTVVEVLRWVLRVICRWIWVAVTVLVIVCIVIVLIIVFA